jgi:hypothetical protein
MQIIKRSFAPAPMRVSRTCAHTLTAAIAALWLTVGSTAGADKGESRAGKQNNEQGQDVRRGSFQGYSTLGISYGDMPAYGRCRVWHPGKPVEEQPPPGKCPDLRESVPLGAWLISRVGQRPQEAEVAAYDTKRRGMVVDIGVFDARTGSAIRIVDVKDRGFEAKARHAPRVMEARPSDR